MSTLCWAIASLVALSFSAHAADSYNFALNAKTLPSYTQTVGAENGKAYFEPGAPLQGAAEYVTSAKPFFFSVPVAEGNYRVTVKLGDPHGTSTTTIKAELRRLMVEHLETAQGQVEARMFIVNVRRPEIGNTGEKVKLKEREQTSEQSAWDGKLTLEFSDKLPKVAAVKVERVDSVPTIFIAGDSTSTDQAKEPYNSWGQMITAFFNSDVAVANNGESGETARSFFGENRWGKIMSVIRKGDFVLIQFGHNDQKEKGDGIGAFASYTAELLRMVKETQVHGAVPILITSMNRRSFDADGKVTNSLGDFPAAVRKIAEEQHVGLIDLNTLSKTLYEALGTDGSGKLFAGEDRTHHSDYGSYELAKCVIYAIQQKHLPIARYLKRGLSPFDPSHPDRFEAFDLPLDPDTATAKPYGQ